MSKKDKKIEIQITDSKVKVGADQFDGSPEVRSARPAWPTQ